LSCVTQSVRSVSPVRKRPYVGGRSHCADISQEQRRCSPRSP
jgi:hypothetical protein